MHYCSQDKNRGGGSNYIFVHGHQIFDKCTCTKMYKICFFLFGSSLDIDLLAVDNLQ